MIKYFYGLIAFTTIVTSYEKDDSGIYVYIDSNKTSNSLTIYEHLEYKKTMKNTKVISLIGKKIVIPFNDELSIFDFPENISNKLTDFIHSNGYVTYKTKSISDVIKINNHTINYIIEAHPASSSGMCGATSKSIISLSIDNKYNLNSLWLNRGCINGYNIEKMIINLKKMEATFLVNNRFLVKYSSNYSQNRLILNDKFIAVVPLSVLDQEQDLQSITDILLKYGEYDLKELVEGVDYY